MLGNDTGVSQSERFVSDGSIFLRFNISVYLPVLKLKDDSIAPKE